MHAMKNINLKNSSNIAIYLASSGTVRDCMDKTSSLLKELTTW